MFVLSSVEKTAGRFARSLSRARRLILSDSFKAHYSGAQLKFVFQKTRTYKKFPSGGSYERNVASFLRSTPPVAKKIRGGRTDSIAFIARSHGGGKFGRACAAGPKLGDGAGVRREIFRQRRLPIRLPFRDFSHALFKLFSKRWKFSAHTGRKITHWWWRGRVQMTALRMTFIFSSSTPTQPKAFYACASILSRSLP